MQLQNKQYGINSAKLRRFKPIEFYWYGYCDIFARAASKRFKKPIYAFLETRTTTINGYHIEGDGLIHAFLLLTKEGLAFDAGGFTTLEEISDRYKISLKDSWLTEITPEYLIKLGYRKYNKHIDRENMHSAKQFIKHSFRRKDFKKLPKLT